MKKARKVVSREGENKSKDAPPSVRRNQKRFIVLQGKLQGREWRRSIRRRGKDWPKNLHSGLQLPGSHEKGH